MGLVESLADLLGDAQKALSDLPTAGMTDISRVAWLERHLIQLVHELQSLLLDLQDGFSGAELGFDGDEAIERIGDLAVEISSLKSMIQVAKMLGR